MDALPQTPPTSGVRTSAADGDFWLVAEPGGYRHRGIDISSKVGGLCELALEQGFRMHPEDVASLGLADGDPVRVVWDGEETGAAGAVKADPECSRGAVYVTRRIIPGGLKRVKEMEPLERLPGNPARVRVRRAED
jgi:hypothetical protein